MMWDYVLARLVDECYAIARLVCEFYDITGIYAEKDNLEKLYGQISWSMLTSIMKNSFLINRSYFCTF